jgi:hypothetical protein
VKEFANALVQTATPNLPLLPYPQILALAPPRANVLGHHATNFAGIMAVYANGRPVNVGWDEVVNRWAWRHSLWAIPPEQHRPVAEFDMDKIARRRPKNWVDHDDIALAERGFDAIPYNF